MNPARVNVDGSFYTNGSARPALNDDCQLSLVAATKIDPTKMNLPDTKYPWPTPSPWDADPKFAPCIKSFLGQPGLGPKYSTTECTYFLVSDNVAATSGHCVETDNAKENVLLFGYKYTPDGLSNARHLRESFFPWQVREVERVIYRQNDDAASSSGNPAFATDIALVALKPLPASTVQQARSHGGTIKPLRVRREGTPAVDTPLLTLGYPAGLPQKCAFGKRKPPTSFEKKYSSSGTAQLVTQTAKTMGGFSGSPVINVQTGLVEGVHSRSGNNQVKSVFCDKHVDGESYFVPTVPFEKYFPCHPNETPTSGRCRTEQEVLASP